MRSPGRPCQCGDARAPLRSRAADDLAFEPDFATDDRLEAGDAAQQRCLAAARGPSRQAMLPVSTVKETSFTTTWLP